MDSILNSIKKLLGIAEDYTNFDNDLIMHINSVFMILNQLGVGPKDGFTITNEKDVWNDFIKDTKNIESIKSYIYLKVKLMFDPSASSVVTESINKTISELEWRLNVSVDNPTTDKTE